ncbi:hypothetical protein DDV21_001130 [Streptococcus chenjunshii]|uniref:Uncharacterized protein n=1 Tax=Streptococcus chenjunshii TaxID=2173853 RepID=A0A372KKE2_9STRE|nr:hypothetical protein [Streptococcus chenjunshii]AXQ77773.1 hypothetical protein DDV21_001130 [Streptococcus chenjunshii]RFU50495.1 hypothetical protein DDV22_08465 [Streptococcus chenjunshii]RFU52723.1 hypothetical protein DDV23_08305 [Streptococcus chenjunshii]
MLKVDDYIQYRFREFNIEAWVVGECDELLRIRLTKFEGEEWLENFVYAANTDENINLLRVPVYGLLNFLFNSPRNKHFYRLGW